MKHSLFNWVNISSAPILEHRHLAEKNTQSLPLKIMKITTVWLASAYRCYALNCFIRY